MHFTIIGSKKSQNTIDLCEEIIRSGHEVDCLGLSHAGTLFQGANAKAISELGSILDTTDILLFRAFEKNYALARVLARMALDKHQVVIDEAIAHHDIANKVSQAQLFQAAGIPHPKTLYTLSPKIFAAQIDTLGLPLIAKPIHGARGEDIHLLKTRDAAIAFFLEHPKTHLYQEYIPITSDIRVFIVGNTVLGAMRRYTVPGDIRSNVSLGAKTEALDPSPELSAFALHITQLFSYEIAGVDIMETATGHMTIEINHTPQWQGFKQATGIDPAKEIVQYALNKHAEKHSLSA